MASPHTDDARASTAAPVRVPSVPVPAVPGPASGDRLPVVPAQPGARYRWPARPAVAFAVLALLFFSGPWITGALGQHAAQIENRPLAEFPPISDGWAFFPELNQWAIDHLPLRDRAVSANGDFSEALFGELPATDGAAPTAILGKDGWLFLNDDISQACRMVANQPVIDQQFVRMQAVAHGIGKPFFSTIVPDKTTVEADRLPSRYPLKVCAKAAKAALWSQLQTRPPPSYIDLLGPIMEVKSARGAAYKPQDTHWNDYGNIAYAQQLVGAIYPRALSDTEVVETGTRSMPGDLNLIRGRPGPTYFPGAEIRRAGITTTRTDGSVRDKVLLKVVGTAASTQAPLVPGRTLIIGDSFSYYAMPWLIPFFEEVDLVDQSALDQAGFADLLRSSDRVIVEMVERNYVLNAMPMLTADYLAGIAAYLAPAG